MRSRSFEEVLSEAGKLAENGYQELVLSGIHLSSYGIDRGENLLHLIQETANIKGIERIRLSSLEPRIVTEEFVSAISQISKATSKGVYHKNTAGRKISRLTKAVNSLA